MRIEKAVIIQAEGNYFGDSFHSYRGQRLLEHLSVTKKQMRRYMQSGKAAKLSSTHVFQIRLLAKLSPTTDQATAKTLLKAVEAKYKK